jgi:Biopolymer transport protein
MAGGGGGSESGEPEFQVAPMIDVLLTILVFFMTITSAQVLKVDKSIQLPIAKDAQKKDNTRAEAVLNVGWNRPAKKAQFVFDDHTYQNAAEWSDRSRPLVLRARKRLPRVRIRLSAQSSAAIAMCPRRTFPRR